MPGLTGIGHRPGYHVPGHQVPQLRVQLFHKIPGLALPVDKKPPALAPRRLADQHPLAADLHRGGVVLDHLQIRQRRAFGKGQRRCAAGILCRSGGHAGKQAIQPPAGQEHRPVAAKRHTGEGIPYPRAAANAVFDDEVD